MNNANFMKLIGAIKLHWTANRGLVAELRKTMSEEPLMVLAIGSEVNGRFTPTKGKLWNEHGNLVYSGELVKSDLRKHLTMNRICHAHFRTSNSTADGKEWKSKQMCLGDSSRCKKNCPLKARGGANAEPDTLSGIGKTVSEDRNS